MRILLIEDDRDTREFTRRALGQDGHVVDAAEDGRQGLFLASTERYDVIVLDRMLPVLDGMTLLKTLRGAGNRTPVLLLSALAEVDHRVEGLRAGADDYLTKPFAHAELSARLDNLRRRNDGAAGEAATTTLVIADLHLDLLKRDARRGARRIELQPREFRLLEYLMRHAGQVVTRAMLLESVWDYHFDPQTNVIDVHVSRLRQKIDRGEAVALLHTVRGAGYRLGA